MTKNIPEWITNLALDVYSLIQKYEAMPRFQEMVKEWVGTHEGEINKRREWKEKRSHHFEQGVGADPRLQDKESGPPEESWQWETYVMHTCEETDSGSQRTGKTISAWVPPELLMSAEPEITHLLPLSRDHELTLAEKYVVMAAIYDYGRKGTDKIPPWQWPGLNNWDAQGAVSDAKKCIFFESLCDEVSRLLLNDEGWLRALLDDVEKDVSNGIAADLSQPKKETHTVSPRTRTDRLFTKAKNHPVISIIIFLITVFIAFGTVVEKFDSIVAFYYRIVGQQEKHLIQMERTEDQAIVTATCTVEITIISDKKGKEEHIFPGTYLTFEKGGEALIAMSSRACTSEQRGNNSVRYSSRMSMKTTDQGLTQPLSLLKQAEYIQICLKPMPANSRILSGKALCVFNGNISIEIQIPSQQMSGAVIMIRDMDPILAALKQPAK